MAKNNKKANEVEKTGLYWTEKRSEVEKVILPFQTVETVNESKKDRDELALFRQKGEPAPGWRNKLIWGDNKYIMASLLSEFAGKINLIYIDPPFASNREYNFQFTIELEGLEWTKEETIIEEVAYRDTWGKGLDSYLQMMYDRLVLMRELLADNGSIYVHLDWHAGHYVKILMDEIFGKENFRNEVIWYYPDYLQGNVTRRFPRKNDFIIHYSKQDNFKFYRVKEKLHKPVKRNKVYWDKKTQRMELVRDKDGKIVYEEYTEKYCDTVWQIGQTSVTRAQSAEYLPFDTQKPEKLLRRIILSTTDKEDIVVDFFGGSGTTGAVAEKLGRRWIVGDLSKFAIHITRKRLLDIEACKPFEVLNLGNYQKEKLKENGIVKYIDFILKLYRAEPVAGYSTIHGQKASRMVHIGAVDSILTEREIRDTIKECSSAGIKAVDFLGWDFEMGLHDLVDTIGDEYKVKIRLVQIPKEALEVRDAAREEIRFFDLNFLEIEHKLNNKSLTISLKDFVISNPEYLPDEVREKIKNFTDYIDYWAVDFNFRDDTFHNMWQSFRMKKHPSLEKRCSYSYEDSGKYKVLVKVVDIFGNDTNKLLEVEVS